MSAQSNVELYTPRNGLICMDAGHFRQSYSSSELLLTHLMKGHSHDHNPRQLTVDKDVAGDFALRLEAGDAVHERGLACAAAAHERRQHARLARQCQPLRQGPRL